MEHFRKQWYGMYKGKGSGGIVYLLPEHSCQFNFIDNSAVLDLLPRKVKKLLKNNGAVATKLSNGGAMIMTIGKLTKELKDVLEVIIGKGYFPIEPK